MSALVMGLPGTGITVRRLTGSAEAGRLADVARSHGATRPPRQIVHFKFLDFDIVTPL
jgi:hypothetical protein